MAKKTTKKKAAKRATSKAKSLPTPPTQIEVPGAEDERHKYHKEVDAHAIEVCAMVQQQEMWRKRIKKAKPLLDAAMDKAGITEYYTANGHRADRSAGKVTTTITLAKDEDGLMEEPTDDGPKTTTIEVGE